jgi:ferredoxin
MAKITYIINGKPTEVEAKVGSSLLQIGLDNGLPIEHACGGNGFCTTCLCSVKTGGEHLAPRGDREEHMGITEDPQRLSCQAMVEKDGDMTIEINDSF